MVHCLFNMPFKKFSPPPLAFRVSESFSPARWRKSFLLSSRNPSSSMISWRKASQHWQAQQLHLFFYTCYASNRFLIINACSSMTVWEPPCCLDFISTAPSRRCHAPIHLWDVPGTQVRVEIWWIYMFHDAFHSQYYALYLPEVSRVLPWLWLEPKPQKWIWWSARRMLHTVHLLQLQLKYHHVANTTVVEIGQTTCRSCRACGSVPTSSRFKST